MTVSSAGLSPHIFRAALLLTLTSCLERDPGTVNPCTRSRTSNTVNVSRVNEVDLLFVIDNSGSMAAEQQKVREQLGRMVRVLTTGDRSPDDGVDNPEFPPVRSLHVGVVSTDMGLMNGRPGAATQCPGSGDNGALWTFPGGASPSPSDICPNSTTTTHLASAQGNAFCNGVSGSQRFVEFERDGSRTADQVSAEIGCLIAGVGICGCGIERQMDAVLGALMPNSPGANGTDPALVIPTVNGAQGGSALINSGFLRPNSVLAIVLVTDEADASFAENISPTQAFGGASFGRDVALTPAFQRPIADIARAIAGLRRVRSQLIFAAIAGVPEDAVGLPTAQILARPEMQLTASNGANCPPWVAGCATTASEVLQELVPACADSLSPGNREANAAPGTQYVQLIAELNRLDVVGTTLQSICADDYQQAIDAVIEKITAPLISTCLPRPLNKDSGGLVQCQMIETLSAGQRCSDLGLTFHSTVNASGEQRERCTLTQLPSRAVQAGTVPAGQVGWYYDDFGSDVRTNCGTDQRLSFFGREPEAGSVVDLDCLQTISRSEPNQVGLGTFCDPDAASNPCTAAGLVCDPWASGRTCQQACLLDSDCEDEGLDGYVCDTRVDLVEDPQGRAHNVCVNPTCG